MLLAALVCTAAPAAAAVDDQPQGLTGSGATLARVRALYDHANPHERGRGMVQEEWRLFQDGIVGSLRVRRLGTNSRETTLLGPFASERGVVRGTHWEQTRNGIVFTTQGLRDRRDQIVERALRGGEERDVRLAGESAALGAFVVELNPSGGYHEWIFIDKKTGYLVRREKVDRGRRVITTYDDYKIVDGAPDPSRIRVTDSLGNERDQILTSRAVDETPDQHEFEMPAGRHLVTFTDRMQAVRLPVRIVNGLIVVRVLVGKSGYDFLLDSGAAGIVVDPAVADQQNFERWGRRIGTTMGPYAESTAIAPAMTIGSLTLHNVVARVVPIPFRADDRTRIAGLLGFDFFADAVVHLDLERGVVEALAPDRFRPPADATAVALSFDERIPALRTRVGPQMARAILDTGANRSVFESAFAERADFAPERIAATSVRGLGGTVRAETARAPWIDLGGIPLRDPLVDVTASDIGGEDIDGLIGTDIMRGYDLWIDYRAAAAYVRLHPRAHLRR